MNTIVKPCKLFWRSSWFCFFFQVANIQNNILDIKENIDDLLNLSDLPSLAAEYLRDIKSSILEIIEELNGVKTVITPDISDDVKLVENYR